MPVEGSVRGQGHGSLREVRRPSRHLDEINEGAAAGGGSVAQDVT